MESYFTGFKIKRCLKEESLGPQHRHGSDSLTGMTQFLPQFQSELWTGPARVNFLPSSSSNRFSLAHKYLKHWNTFWPRLLRHSATRRGGFGSAVLHHVCLQVPLQVQVLLLATQNRPGEKRLRAGSRFGFTWKCFLSDYLDFKFFNRSAPSVISNQITHQFNQFDLFYSWEKPQLSLSFYPAVLYVPRPFFFFFSHEQYRALPVCCVCG